MARAMLKPYLPPWLCAALGHQWRDTSSLQYVRIDGEKVDCWQTSRHCDRCDTTEIISIERIKEHGCAYGYVDAFGECAISKKVGACAHKCIKELCKAWRTGEINAN